MEIEKSSKKRGTEGNDGKKKKEKNTNETKDMDQEIEFEDAFEDEYEEEENEEVVFDDNEEDEESMDVDERSKREQEKLATFLKEEQESEQTPTIGVWRPGIDKLKEGEVLEYDPTAYVMLHQLKMEWPCLSFDIIPDKLGFQRTRFPLSMYYVTGTQAAENESNKLLILKASSLHKTMNDENSDDEDDDDELDDDPEIEFKSLIHPGSVNRIRVMPQEPHFVASWSDDRCLYLECVTICKSVRHPTSFQIRIRDTNQEIDCT